MLKSGKRVEFPSHFSVSRVPVLTCEKSLQGDKGVGYYPRIINMFEGFQNMNGFICALCTRIWTLWERTWMGLKTSFYTHAKFSFELISMHVCIATRGIHCMLACQGLMYFLVLKTCFMCKWWEAGLFQPFSVTRALLFFSLPVSSCEKVGKRKNYE